MLLEREGCRLLNTRHHLKSRLSAMRSVVGVFDSKQHGILFCMISDAYGMP